MNKMISIQLGARRLILVLRAVVSAFWNYFVNIVLPGHRGKRPRLVEWSAKVARDFVHAFDIKVTVKGTLPTQGIIASNHLSYLDIPLLASIAPMNFVSKQEVKYWPVFGWFGILAGTLFLRRNSKSHAVEVARQFEDVVGSGVLLTLFPEGTSTDGSYVKPFHSTLFEPAARLGWPATPVWIKYSVGRGTVERDICFVGDMMFLPHFLRLLCLDGIEASVVIGEPMPGNLNRKDLAKGLHRQVCRIAAENSGCERRANPQVEWADHVTDTLLLTSG
ncbi:MAG: 1-acyl-sn-glycerol-3-phosphate acyltransferase [Verrucomicrobiae bacterium]|nr:1-acyl-sn-glycerol-3-phosphate acyltransferase [Verrucomicrobiae bacterium]